MELVIEDAVVVTMSAGRRDGRGDAGKDGRIAEVGSAEAVRAAAAPGARVIGLDGATVIPGLIDAHCHVADVGYLATAADCSQPSAPDIPAIQARLREAAARTPEASWVTGGGYVEYKLREGRHPTRADLDQAVPHRPAVLYHTSLHACVLNSGRAGRSRVLRRAAGPCCRRARPRQRGPGSTAWCSRPRCSRSSSSELAPRTSARMDAAQRARLCSGRERLAAIGLTAACDADMRRDTSLAYAEADANGPLEPAGLRHGRARPGTG